MRSFKNCSVASMGVTMFGLIALTVAQVAPLTAQEAAPAEGSQAEPAQPQKPLPAILVLDPSEKVWSLQVEHGSRLVVKKGDVFVNSTHQSALWNTDSSIEAQEGNIGVVGGVHRMGKNSTSPAPQTMARAVGNPYPEFRIPVPRDIQSTQKLFISNKRQVTLRPGIYTGGIFAAGKDMVITLQPGVYVMNNGDFFVSGAKLEGKGVTIVQSGTNPGKFWTAHGAQLDLAAPTEGILKDLVIVSRAKGVNTVMVYIGGTTGKLVGTIYAPEAGVGILHTADVSVTRVICLNLWINGSALEVTGETNVAETNVADGNAAAADANAAAAGGAQN